MNPGRRLGVAVAILAAAGCSTTSPKPAESQADTAARLKSELEAKTAAYERRPTVKFVSGRKAGEFQDYVAHCLERILTTGNANYPPAARGKLYGNVRVTFWLEQSGNLLKVEIDRGSGQPILDNAIVESIRKASPFPRFPDQIVNPPDMLAVTQTFSFDPGDDLEERP